jgi:nucleoside-diphosphate-sugar epimerase
MKESLETLHKSLRGWQHRKAFVTGATGLIGGEVLHDLLELPQVEEVVCLVRPSGGRSGIERLAQRLKRAGPRGKKLDEMMSRVRVVEGSVTEKLWGMSEENLRWVRKYADLFIHCAASTSFVDAQSCEVINVTGTRYMLDVVRGAESLNRLVHFSTATVCGYLPNAVVKEEDSLRNGGPHVVAYTRTKAEAERLLWEVADELPLLVLRPSITLARGTRDRKMAKLFLWSFIAMARLPYVPANLDALTDVVTLDFVVRCTMRLIAKGDKLKYNLYHLTSGKQGAVSGREAYEILCAKSTRSEFPEVVRPEDWDETHQRAIAEQGLSGLYEAIDLYLPYLNLNVVYDNTRLVEELGEDLPHLPKFVEYVNEMIATIDPDLIAMGTKELFGF